MRPLHPLMIHAILFQKERLRQSGGAPFGLDDTSGGIRAFRRIVPALSAQTRAELEGCLQVFRELILPNRFPLGFVEHAHAVFAVVAHLQRLAGRDRPHLAPQESAKRMLGLLQRRRELFLVDLSGEIHRVDEADVDPALEVGRAAVIAQHAEAETLQQRAEARRLLKEIDRRADDETAGVQDPVDQRREIVVPVTFAALGVFALAGKTAAAAAEAQVVQVDVLGFGAHILRALLRLPQHHGGVPVFAGAGVYKNRFHVFFLHFRCEIPDEAFGILIPVPESTAKSACIHNIMRRRRLQRCGFCCLHRRNIV